MQIFVGFFGEGASNVSDWSEPAAFSNFGRYIFEPLELKLTLSCDVMKYFIGFPKTLEWLTLNDVRDAILC